MRKSYYSEKEFRGIRFVALAIGILAHCVVVIGLYYLQQKRIEADTIEELLFGSSGGGGGEDGKEQTIEFGPQSLSRDLSGPDPVTTKQFTLMNIHVYSDVEQAAPVPVKAKPKVTGKKKQQSIIAENLPLRHLRRGVGPGNGGGTGGGSGGGIGAGQGYAIDWGGTGGRRLLSGRLPEYPKGTDKQMAVVLQFTVLPDGSVDRIIPVRKTDELLERSAMTALQTWRFDPLPLQLEQKSQTGKITFKFKLE